MLNLIKSIIRGAGLISFGMLLTWSAVATVTAVAAIDQINRETETEEN